MSFSEEFNSVSAGMTFSKDNDVQLRVTQPGVYYSATYHYNFMTRTMLYSGGTTDHKSGVAVIPFADLDPEVLDAMHAKLVELGGNPPALPSVDGQRSLIRKNNP